MCSPPANRRVAATSALRQQGLVTSSLDSSSLTFAVIAMPAILPPCLRPTTRPTVAVPPLCAGICGNTTPTRHTSLGSSRYQAFSALPRGEVRRVSDPHPQRAGRSEDGSGDGSGDDVSVGRGQPQRVVLPGVAHGRDG